MSSGETRTVIPLLWAWSRLVLSGISLVTAAPTVVRPVRAWAQVAGHTDFVTVEAQDAAMAEVLATRSAQLRLHLDASKGLDLVVSGTFQVPLKQVLAPLLVGYDYVAKYSKDSVKIIVVGPSRPDKAVSTSDDSLPVMGLGRHSQRSRPSS
jgi:hypothetical protein